MQGRARIVDDLAAEGVAREIMDEFAGRTGMSTAAPQRRYLWTDAFALCNWLTLFERSGEPRFRELARLLMHRVHHVLGRHRPDDPRNGWISGLEETEGERHPTVGGLRIGKPLPERSPREPFDAHLEWERDGQYYHYLLRWMHALSRAAVVLQDAELGRWAVELAVTAERAFTLTALPGGPARMRWKMSIDLLRPLVPSQGAHDPLDGLVTSCAVSASMSAGDPAAGDLRRALHELLSMCRADEWATADSLGAGGLLCDLWWSVQMLRADAPESDLLEPLLRPMLSASLTSVREVLRSPDLGRPSRERLAFRELGLAIGLRAAGEIVKALPELPTRLRPPGIDELERYVGVADRVVGTWLEPAARATASWRAHEDINEVMLATALLPDEHIRV